MSAIYKNGTWYGQGGSGSSGGHTIEDGTGTELTQRTTMQFGNGMSASDDSTDEKTVVEVDTMPSTDMSEIITPLPSIPARYQKYSTDEQVIGEWIDSKPLYQKTFSGTSPATDGEVATGLTGIDNAFLTHCYIKGTGGYTLNTAYKDNYVDVKSDGSAIYFSYSGSVFVNKPFFATIQYTKTTD